LPAIASAGGADRREHGENADLAPSREEIARAAVFLASDNAGFVTGQTLHVNGGSYRS
jgi:NAD(P)-dependent dehydrogenase (short-subunit alcohol dehydrogenase family)